MKLPIYQIKNIFKKEFEDEEKLKKLPHNQLVKEPLKSEDYAPSDLPPNEFMSTDADAVPEPEKPKKLYDEYDSRFTESQ